MPLPFIIGAAAAAGAVGVGATAHGAKKMKDANDTMKWAKEKQESSVKKFEVQNKITCESMDAVGKKELEILDSFKEFGDVFEKIKGRPEFKDYKKEGVDIPKLSKEEIKEVSVGAGVLLGGLGGAALGTAGGFAAAGATTAAVMALGTASTGTAIASLSGAALTNATLAALGGGAIAAGGGGIALGTTVLGAATLGIGFLVGGAIFSITGGKLSEKADEAYYQACQIESEVNCVCEYLTSLDVASKKFLGSLNKVNRVYRKHLDKLNEIVITNGVDDWRLFSDEEKLITENTTYLVQLLFTMCKTKLVLKAENDNETNEVNTTAIEKRINEVNSLISDILDSEENI